MAEGVAVPTEARIYPCRDFFEKLNDVIPAGAPVVVGGRSGFHFSHAERLVRKLRRTGYQAVLAERS